MKDPIDYNGVFRVSITVSVTLPEKIAQHAALFFVFGKMTANVTEN